MMFIERKRLYRKFCCYRSRRCRCRCLWWGDDANVRKQMDRIFIILLLAYNNHNNRYRELTDLRSGQQKKNQKQSEKWCRFDFSLTFDDSNVFFFFVQSHLAQMTHISINQLEKLTSAYSEMTSDKYTKTMHFAINLTMILKTIAKCVSRPAITTYLSTFVGQYL